jgi:hypothetical protein
MAVHSALPRRAIEDVGPAGADKGQGGKYLLLR